MFEVPSSKYVVLPVFSIVRIKKGIKWKIENIHSQNQWKGKDKKKKLSVLFDFSRYSFDCSTWKRYFLGTVFMQIDWYKNWEYFGIFSHSIWAYFIYKKKCLESSRNELEKYKYLSLLGAILLLLIGHLFNSI